MKVAQAERRCTTFNIRSSTSAHCSASCWRIIFCFSRVGRRGTESRPSMHALYSGAPIKSSIHADNLRNASSSHDCRVQGVCRGQALHVRQDLACHSNLHQIVGQCLLADLIKPSKRIAYGFASSNRDITMKCFLIDLDARRKLSLPAHQIAQHLHKPFLRWMLAAHKVHRHVRVAKNH